MSASTAIVDSPVTADQMLTADVDDTGMHAYSGPVLTAGGGTSGNAATPSSTLTAVGDSLGTHTIEGASFPDPSFGPDTVFRNSILGRDGPLVDGPAGFSGPTTYHLFNAGLKRAEKARGSFGLFASGKYHWLTYHEMAAHSYLFGNGLINLGLVDPVVGRDGEARRMLGIYSEHRVGWTITELAAARQNITLVPIYNTANPDFVSSILDQTQITTVVASTQTAEKLMSLLLNKRTNVNQIVLLGEVDDEIRLLRLFPHSRIPLIHFSTVKQAGKQGGDNWASPDDVNTICFTSGTTGDPKGVLVTHRMLISVVGAATMAGFGLNVADTYFAFLPPAHIFSRIIDLTFMYTGARIGYFSGNKSDIARDIKLVKPTILAAVPRFLEKTLEKIQAQTLKTGRLGSLILSHGLKNSDRRMHAREARYRGAPLPLISRYPISKIRESFGGRLRLILSGGGPLNPQTQQLLKTYLHAYVAQGYGLTETTGGSLIQNPTTSTYGLVGIPMACVMAKLTDQDKHAHLGQGAGEILLKGPSVFKGYYGRHELDTEVFTADGWFRTGDIARVVLDRDGLPQMKIVGRSKEIFKLANGEYLVPTLIESNYKLSDAVEEIFIDVSSNNDYAVAVLNVKSEYLDDYLRMWNRIQEKEIVDFIPLVKTELSEDVLNSASFGLKAQVMRSLTMVADELEMAPTDRVRDVYISSTYFGLDTDFQTATAKQKRGLLRSHFADKIATLE